MGAHGGPRPLRNEDQNAIPARAVGGTEMYIDADDGNTYLLHMFTEPGSYTLNVTDSGLVEYLVVAGGGGGSVNAAPGGGGGAGEAINDSDIISANTYSIQVGSGGIGGFYDFDASTITRVSEPGSNSTFGIVEANGGSVSSPSVSNRFASRIGGTSGSGNIGGDGVRLSIDSVNNATTNFGGGGGGQSELGKGASGTTATALSGPDGGAGIASIVTGSEQYYGGGGGGGRAYARATGRGLGGLGGGGDGADTSRESGDSAIPNTGGGGGGAGRAFGRSVEGGNGGSGIVIVRYRVLRSEYDANQ